MSFLNNTIEQAKALAAKNATTKANCLPTSTDPVCQAFYANPAGSGVQAGVNQVLTAGGINPFATAVGATPWYTSWWGIGLLAVGGVGAAYYYKKSKKAG